MSAWWRRFLDRFRGTAAEGGSDRHAEAQEFGALSQSFQESRAAIEARLVACVDALEKGGGDRRALHALREERARLRQLVQRLALAESTTAELQQEWEDWRQYAGRLDSEGEHRRLERMELLRSELALRGIRLAVDPAPQESYVTSGRGLNVESASDEPVDDVVDKVHAVVRDDLSEVRTFVLPALEKEIEASCPATGCTERDAERWMAAVARHQRRVHGVHRLLSRTH